MVSETLKNNPDDENEVHDLDNFEDAGSCIVTPVASLPAIAANALVAAMAQVVRNGHAVETALTPDNDGVVRAQYFEEGLVYMLAKPMDGYSASRYVMDLFNVGEREACSRMHYHTGARMVRLITGEDTTIRVSALSPFHYTYVDGVTPFKVEVECDKMPDSTRNRYSFWVPESSIVDMQIPRGTSHQFNSFGDNAVIDTIHPEETIEAFREKMSGLRMMAQTVFLSDAFPSVEDCGGDLRR
ncbi:hypothetical protein [Streptomyces sp. SCSIO ZS0520]|uniref:hypothetical protein n=1 Tax=Streptomyces sp. SCSIO ZS0520 TaxID=2892996 RepID=UPI0021DB0999|nr:hypothetical protein [Streptomyces sp. SCSIO ZS0520]